ncbi:MAG: hypothetical protein IT244_04060, partial [Bacteroidia bacterium]|nr:hypothetical protein [Bacteroidia bacterium]
INVFAGVKSVKIPSSACGIAVDHLYTQVFPTNILGKKHVLMPFKDQSKGYVFRILATKANTKMYVNGALVATKNAGEWYQQDVTTNSAVCVTSDSSIYVMQYMKNGGSCAGTTGNNGDPAILIMPDQTQKMLKTVVGTATTNNMKRHYVNILVNSNATKAVKLNGTYISSTLFTNVSCAGQSFVQVQVNNPSTNTIECDSGLIVVAYGMGEYESYSYCSGALFENLEYDFTMERNGKCPGENVKLTAIVKNPKVKKIMWDFGDGGKDTGKIVNHRFQKVGSFFVLMKVAVPGACGTTDTITRSKIISILPGPVFNIPDTVFQCADTLKYTFTGPLNKNFFYKWHDSTSSNAYTAKTAGRVWFRINDTSSKCSLTDSSWVLRHNKLLTAFKGDTIDKCWPTNFFSLVDNTTYSGDAYKSASWKISRYYIQSVSKRDTFSTLDRFRIKFDTTGQYPTKYVVTSQKGCVDSITTNLGVYRLPTAVFNTLKPEYCQKESAKFVDSSFGEGGIAKTYWDFGNGSKATGTPAIYTYNTFDTFKVNLITETIHGCRDTVDSMVIVHPLPVMKIASVTKEVCKKANSFDFSDNSTIAHGSMSNTWKWEKKSSTATLNLNAVKFSDTGNFVMTLSNKSDKGCIDSIKKSVYVAPEPVAKSIATDSSRCFDVHFYNLSDVSTIVKGSIASRTWKFSDGTSATTGTITKKKFSTYGTYTAKLVVTSATYNCKDSVSRNMVIFAAPNAQFNVNDSVQCEPNNKFDFSPVTSFSVGGVSATYAWDFGDLSPVATSESASRSYGGLGKFNVRYIVKTSQNCADTATRTMEVVGAPKAVFTTSKDSSCLNSHKYDFINTTIFGGSYNSKWTLGDGNTAVTKDVIQKSYVNAGTFNIKLLVTTPSGCADSTLRTVYVLPIPQSAFTVNTKTQCLTGNNFTFTNTTATNGASPMLYTWTITPGGTFKSQNLSNQAMADTGSYDVSLKASSAFGCSTTFADKIYVAENPTVTFTAG